MIRTSLAAALAVPVLLAVPISSADANPPVAANFGCGGYCFKLFPHLHQHGPLFNYGPYYGYYPFAPYGPWDAYLRYDPNFYGDAGAHAGGNYYGKNPYLFNGSRGGHGGSGCTSCGFWHASWSFGGWFRGHQWLHGGFGCKSHACNACSGAPAAGGCDGSGSAPAHAAHADPVARYSGIGSPAQSAVFYPGAPALNPLAAK
jgi:hypothetical protein